MSGVLVTGGAGYIGSHAVKALAARGERDAVAVRRELGGGEKVHRLLHPGLPHLIEIGDQAHGQRRVLIRRDVEDPQVGAELVDDAAVVEVGRGHFPAAVEGVLAEIESLLVHGPQIHRAVAVRDEVDAAVPRHRRLAASDRGDRHPPAA